MYCKICHEVLKKEERRTCKKCEEAIDRIVENKLNEIGKLRMSSWPANRRGA